MGKTGSAQTFPSTSHWRRNRKRAERAVVALTIMAALSEIPLTPERATNSSSGEFDYLISMQSAFGRNWQQQRRQAIGDGPTKVKFNIWQPTPVRNRLS